LNFSLTNSSRQPKKIPTLEIPTFTSGVVAFIYILSAVLIAWGFYWATGTAGVRHFLVMPAIPLVLFIFRSRLTFLAFLVSGTICTAFMTLGAP